MPTHGCEHSRGLKKEGNLIIELLRGAQMGYGEDLLVARKRLPEESS